MVAGGGDKHIWELAVELKETGHQVHLFGMKYWEGESSYVEDGVQIHGVMPATSIYNESGKRSIFQPLVFGFYIFIFFIKNRDFKFENIDCISFPSFPASALRLLQVFGVLKSRISITWLEVCGSKYWNSYLGKPLGWIGFLIEKLVVLCAKYHLAISPT